jgi:hypothetical protein
VLEFQAERMPPCVLAALIYWIVFVKLGGRKLWAWN